VPLNNQPTNHRGFWLAEEVVGYLAGLIRIYMFLLLIYTSFILLCSDTSKCTKLAATKVSCSATKVPNSVGVIFPVGRRGHTAVVNGSSMFVYGGYVDMKGSSSELWEFHIGNQLNYLIVLIL